MYFHVFMDPINMYNYYVSVKINSKAKTVLVNILFPSASMISKYILSDHLSWVFFCTNGFSSQGFIPLFFLIYTSKSPSSCLYPQGYVKITFILRNFILFNLCLCFGLNNFWITWHLLFDHPERYMYCIMHILVFKCVF
jgi:hypothetical protein